MRTVKKREKNGGKHIPAKDTTATRKRAKIMGSLRTQRLLSSLGNKKTRDHGDTVEWTRTLAWNQAKRTEGIRHTK